MTPLTPTQETDIREILEARRDELHTKVNALGESPELGAAQGFGKRIGDGTIEAVRRLTDIGVGSSMEFALARTERALAKLDEGTYGVCDDCGQPIGEGRLRAMPDGVQCLECAAANPPRPPSGR